MIEQQQSFVDRLYKDRHGRVVLLQLPNAALLTGIIALGLQKTLPYGQLNFLAALISYGALFTWAWLELFQGASYLRRALGLLVLIWLISSRL